MPAPSLTYTLTNGTTADASQVMQNFNDLLNGVTDGTKDLSISALTCAGTATLNGHVNLGNSSADDLTITASLAATLPIKTNTSFDIGSSTKGLQYLYMGGSSTFTCRIGVAALAASRNYTIPDAGTNVNFILSAGNQTISDTTTFSTAIKLNSSGATASDLDFYATTTANVGHTGVWASTQTVSYRWTRIGNIVTVRFPQVIAAGNSTAAAITISGTNWPSWARPGAQVVLPVFVRNNGTLNTTPGAVVVTTSGDLTLQQTYATTSFTSTTSNVGLEAGSYSFPAA